MDGTVASIYTACLIISTEACNTSSCDSSRPIKSDGIRFKRWCPRILPFKYFGRLLPGGRFFRQVYYKGRTERGEIDWCETDGLTVFDDHLFVIEAKGGAFTYTPPATDFPAYIASLKNLVLRPVTQGKRFVEYLNSGDLVTLFDKDQRQVGELRRADFRHITICAVTIDPFTEMAAQVQHLRKIGVDVGAEPVWAVSIDRSAGICGCV